MTRAGRLPAAYPVASVNCVTARIGLTLACGRTICGLVNRELNGLLLANVLLLSSAAVGA